MKAQQRVEEVTKALFYHFNKHQMPPMEIAYVLGGTYQTILKQLPPEAKIVFTTFFLNLISDKPAIVTPETPAPAGN